MTFKTHGKLITIHPKKIALNALSGEEEAEKICSWRMREINEIWAKKDEIEPNYEARAEPKVFDLLKLLPNKPGCPKGCGQAACMLFAKLLSEGVKTPADCPHLEQEKKEMPESCLAGFDLG